MFKVASWNLNSINSRLPHLLDFIKEHDADVICLQELKCATDKFPGDMLEHLNYNHYIKGQKTYNGVAILSKIPAENIKLDFPGNPIPNQSRFIETEFHTKFGHLKVISLYAPNGGEVGSDKFKSKLEFYDAFIEYIKSIRSLDTEIIICSDYNIAAFDIDVFSVQDLKNSTCFTYIEKQKLRTLLNMGFVDNYRALHPTKQEFSWWDYRAGAFNQNKGMRIDTILSTPEIACLLSGCSIEYKYRTLQKPSDHAPVISCYSRD